MKISELFNEGNGDNGGGHPAFEKKLPGKAEVGMEAEDDGEIQGYIWIKCDSPEEFHKILQTQDGEVQKFVEHCLSQSDLSLNGIEDYQDPEPEDGGYYMNFRTWV